MTIYRFKRTVLRVVLVTDRFIAKLESRTFKLLKEPLPIASVTKR